MAYEFKSCSFRATNSSAIALEELIRNRFPEASRSSIRKLIDSGKVSVSEELELDTRRLVEPGAAIDVEMTRPRKRATAPSQLQSSILFVDRHIVVANKPYGLSSVDHEGEKGSLQSEIRRLLKQKERRDQPPPKAVHRLDKVTSGVIMFARTHRAQRDLKDQLRAHSTTRRYLAVAHGNVASQTITNRLVDDRGDGYKGVTTSSTLGRESTTHLLQVEQFSDCTLLECRLETGRTHQIRIHLSHLGHPIIGDPVYTHDYRGSLIPYERTLLHAATLGFTHPVTREVLQFEVPLPSTFEQFVQARRQ